MRLGNCWKSISSSRRYDYQQNRISAKHPIRNVTSIYLEQREPARNRQRFYAITVIRTLFDGWAVVREWGRIGQPGKVRETWFVSGDSINCPPSCRGLQSKTVRTAISAISGPDYLQLSVPPGPHYLPLRLQSAARD
jgi:hypothetical protein